MAYSGLLLIFKVIFTFLLMVYFKLYYCKYCFSPEWTLCVASCKALPGFLQAEAIKGCASPVVCSRNCHSRTLPILLIMNLLALCPVLPQTSCLSFSRGLAAPVRLFSHGPTMSVEDVCSASSFLGVSTSSQPRNMSLRFSLNPIFLTLMSTCSSSALSHCGSGPVRLSCLRFRQIKYHPPVGFL